MNKMCVLEIGYAKMVAEKGRYDTGVKVVGSDSGEMLGWKEKVEGNCNEKRSKG